VRILLISMNREAEPFTAAPLGMAKVASSLVAKGHDVRCLDLLFEDDPYAAIEDALSGHKPGLVGLSLRNIESSTEFLLPEYRRYVDHIRSLTDVPLVIGGPGFSVMPGPVMEYLDIGLGIAGEGEASVAMLVDAVESGRNPHSVPNVCTYSDGLFRPPVRRTACPPEEFAPPAWGLLPVERYDMVGVQSKRGCSFSCAYCTYPALEGRRMRLSDPDSVSDEMASVGREYGVEAFYFVDNVFNNPKSHAIAICESLVRSGFGGEWGALVTPVGLDTAFARLMVDSGCVSVEIGADSLSDTTLRALGKPFGADSVEDAVAACKDAGLMQMVFLILGGPEEDERTLRETFERLDRIKPDKVFAVSGIRIYPGTPIAERAVREGIIGPENNLLMPEFYVSPKLGAGLYDMAGEYFGSHPDWIHYRADGVINGPRHKVAKEASASDWSVEATEALETVLAAVPRLMRPIARRAVTRKAASLASGTGTVGVADVRDAFMSETPGPFRSRMTEKLKEMGLTD